MTFIIFSQPLKNQNQNHFLIKDYPFTFTQKAHSPKTLPLNFLTNSVTKVIYIYMHLFLKGYRVFIGFVRGGLESESVDTTNEREVKS